MKDLQPRVAAFAMALHLGAFGCGDDTAAPDAGDVDSGGMDAAIDADGGGDVDTGSDDGAVRDTGEDATDTGGGSDGAVEVRCLPQAIGGEGGCDTPLGIYWNGVECASFSGCTCTGDDCAGVYATLIDCWAERGGCPGLCSAESAAPVGPCDLEWGPYWDGKSCETFTGCDCVGDDCTRGYADKPECELLNRSCLGKCEAQLAEGVGACEAIIGVFWDGSECITIGGCSCLGDDCGDVYDSPEICSFAHRGCAP